MAKRKVNSDEEEDQLANDSSENSESVPKHDLKPRSKTRTSKRDSEAKAAVEAKLSDDQLTSDEDQAPLAKKAKREPVQSKKNALESGDIAVHVTPDGEKYIDLGKKKRATVRSFKGTALVDIREFYGADGAEKPGKKGISLTLEQWETLKIGLPTIDNLFESIQKK